MKKIFKRIIAATAVIALTGGGVLANSNAASAASPYENTDPITTGCAPGAYVVNSWNMVNDVYGQVQGRAELVYSPRCQTNWVNVYGYTGGNRYAVGLWNFQEPPYSNVGAVVYGVQSERSNQTYSPAGSCVDVSWQIRDINTDRVEGSGGARVC